MEFLLAQLHFTMSYTDEGMYIKYYEKKKEKVMKIEG
jgi:hypothetical protein